MEIAKLTKVVKNMLTRVDDFQHTRAGGTEKPRFTTRLGKLLGGLAVLALFSAPSAHAATYLFSFTTNQLLSALGPVNGVGGDPNYGDAAYFSIFLNVPNSGDTYSQAVAPDDWQSSTGSNSPFAANTGAWVEFGKTGTQVTVVAGGSTVNGVSSGAWSIVDNRSYYDNTQSPPAPPVGWGTTSDTIKTQMPGTDVFSFEVSGLSSANLTFTGYTSEVVFCSPYTTHYIFSLPLTGQLVPEPNTIVLLGFGAACLFAGVIRKKAKKRPAA